MKVMENDVQTINEILETNRRLRGLQREEHFAQGLGQESWRGRHNVYVDRRKDRSRRMCREKVRYDE